MDVTEAYSAKAVGQAVGTELRRMREAQGWSRGQFVEQLPSQIGDRTLLSYEHGTRQVSLVRFIELCDTGGSSAPEVLHRALQTARLHMQNLVLKIDLREVLQDQNKKFRPIFQWAHNKMTANPSAVVVDLAPVAVQELADLIGYNVKDLANYLAGFAPVDEDETADTK